MHFRCFLSITLKEDTKTKLPKQKMIKKKCKNVGFAYSVLPVNIPPIPAVLTVINHGSYKYAQHVLLAKGLYKMLDVIYRITCLTALFRLPKVVVQKSLINIKYQFY